ncbi:hypothetical protein DFA_04625 [Cavenderia fasciculata]|uniref:Uncharacterized protein n=1 Tax=Cavenderia fasciculata TaxID=261658 RepID=F4PQ34_CACFS|nr:uncharacterized protein DFA_04625 [Cavenderia fasciculata]EGG22497.1 hypothetical protein DFA_04625 [Cavenderia fasciculata]|eukprot:XP_004360348.1 hypothetical protein DFA_04625 [Cavenderia fasciculata]
MTSMASSFSIDNTTEFDLTILLIVSSKKLCHHHLARDESKLIQNLDESESVLVKVMVLDKSFQFIDEFNCDNHSTITIRPQIYVEYDPSQNGPTSYYTSQKLLEFKQKKYIILHKFGSTNNQVYLV